MFPVADTVDFHPEPLGSSLSFLCALLLASGVLLPPDLGLRELLHKHAGRATGAWAFAHAEPLGFQPRMLGAGMWKSSSLAPRAVYPLEAPAGANGSFPAQVLA